MSNEEMKPMLQAIMEAQQLTHAKVVSLETQMTEVKGDIKTIKETMATKDDIKRIDKKMDHWAKRSQKNELDIALLKEEIGAEF